MSCRDKITKILNNSQQVTFDVDGGIIELKKILFPNGLNDSIFKDPNYSNKKITFINEFSKLIQNFLILPQSANIHFINQFIIKFLLSLIENEEEIKIQKQIVLLILKVLFFFK